MKELEARRGKKVVTSLNAKAAINDNEKPLKLAAKKPNK